jgi:threonine dehydrogenase-like Zn-dependent dehydrogenase
MARYDNSDDNTSLNFAWGGFAQFGNVTDYKALQQDEPSQPTDFWSTQQRAIPDDVPPPHAAMLITFMEVWDWLSRLEVSSRTSVVLWGLGPVALAMAECCKAMGAPLVIGIGVSDASVARAKDFAVDLAINAATTDVAAAVKDATGGRGADRVVEAVGKRSLVIASEAFVATGGRIGVYGIEPNTGTVPQPYQLAGAGHYSLHFFGPNELDAQDEVINRYRQGSLDPGKFITCQRPLDEIGTAVD